MTGDFKQELTALFSHSPQLPDADGFARQVTHDLIRAERRDLMLMFALGVASLVVFVPAAASVLTRVTDTIADVSRAAGELSADGAPAVVAAMVCVAIAAVMFGRIQARRF